LPYSIAETDMFQLSWHRATYRFGPEPFQDQRLATAYRITLRACGFAAPTEAWLYRPAIRENSEASVTHDFGTHDYMSCDSRGAQRPGLDAGVDSPHLAALFQARWALGQRARARHSHGRSATVVKTRTRVE
jgi:hypothetical protein